MAALTNQPTAAPTRKVNAMAVWSLLAAVLMAIMDAAFPDNAGRVAEVLSALEPFVPAIVGTVAGYMTRERAT